MKTMEEIIKAGRTYTLLTCSTCGRQTGVFGKSSNQKVKKAVKRECRTCKPPLTLHAGTNWWRQFGLNKNPYVYGPMPRLRTSERYRIEEARQRGWLAWHWVDEYTDERMGRR
jgi:hypothetical protein